MFYKLENGLYLEDTDNRIYQDINTKTGNFIKTKKQATSWIEFYFNKKSFFISLNELDTFFINNINNIKEIEVVFYNEDRTTVLKNETIEIDNLTLDYLKNLLKNKGVYSIDFKHNDFIFLINYDDKLIIN